jgi:hypothetical protein
MASRLGMRLRSCFRRGVAGSAAKLMLGDITECVEVARGVGL